MAAPRIDDPAKTMERCYERLHFAEEVLADYEARGFDYLCQRQRRRIAGLKATITRTARMMGAQS